MTELLDIVREMLVVTRVPVVNFFTSATRCACPDPLAGRYDPCPSGCGAPVAVIELNGEVSLPGPALTSVELAVFDDDGSRAPNRTCSPMPVLANGERLLAHRLTWVEHDAGRCERRRRHVAALAADPVGTLLRAAASEPDPEARSTAVCSVSPIAGYHRPNFAELARAFDALALPLDEFLAR